MADTQSEEREWRPDIPSGTVTFLFTDIEGSTQLLERLRSEYATLLADHYAVLRAAFANWNGHEIGTQGDACFVSFSRAMDAVACAIEAQRMLAAYQGPQGASVRVRMGLHTGEPIVSRANYVGLDVHLAARIASAGYGGQVLLSQTTRDLIYQDLPQRATLRDLGTHRLKDIRYTQQIYQLDIEGLPGEFPPLKTLATAEELPIPGEPPFKGLQYFDEEDADLFFGREELTAKLVDYVGHQRFLAVIGASGSGKSSIVRAGLVPALKRYQPLADGTRPPSTGTRWRIHIITPTARPLEALATSLTRDSESVTATATLMDDLARDSRSLHLFARRTLDSTPLPMGEGQRLRDRLLLVVDQVEELFTLCRDEGARRAFADNLLYAVGVDGGAITVVMALRADFYAHFSQYDALREAVVKHQEYIGPMSAEGLRRAIEEPARRGGWEFAPGLADLLLHDVGADGDRQPEPGALPLLSHALLETWKRRRGNLMTLKGYSESGGVRGAIARTAERVFYQELTSEQQAIARSIFLRLTELGEGTQDTRRRVARSELIPPTPLSEAAQVEKVLIKLADARLITTGEGTVEVAHEALIREWPTLREWLAQNREGLRLHRHLTETAQEWERLARDTGALYRGARLVQALEWAEANPREINIQERLFLDASKALTEQEEAEREAQRQRELAAAEKLAETERYAAHKLRQRAVFLAGALLVAAGLAIAALIFGQQSNENAQRAEDERRIATVRELSAAALNNLDVDPERSILLALHAVSVSSSGGKPVLREAEDALHRAVQASRVQLTLRGHTAAVWGVTFSPDGTRLATTSVDGTAKVWDAITGRELLTFSVSFSSSAEFGSIFSIVFNPDGTRLATSVTDGVKVWDTTNGRELLTLSGHTGNVIQTAFSPDGRRLATASIDRTVKVWDVSLEGGRQEPLTLYGHAATVFSVAFSPDGRRLAAASRDRTARVYALPIEDIADGTQAETLFTQVAHRGPFYWSPEGNRIALHSLLPGSDFHIFVATLGEPPGGQFVSSDGETTRQAHMANANTSGTQDAGEHWRVRLGVIAGITAMAALAGLGVIGVYIWQVGYLSPYHKL